MSKNRFVATALVMAIAMYSVGCTSDSDTNDIQATSITADEFTQLFAENAENAEKDNKDKFFEITGEYAGDLLESTVIIDTDVVYGNYSECELRFKISADEFSKIPNLDEGDSITLRAEFKSVTSYTLNFEDAIYVSSNKVEESELDSSESESSPTVTNITTTSESEIYTTTTSDKIVSDSVLEFISYPETIGRNEEATVTVKGEPNTEYNIAVFYSDGPSEADGLEDKISDAEGVVSWTWKIGPSTSVGEGKRITVSGGGQNIEVEFTIIE